MKYVIFTFLLAFSAYSNATVKISVANGNWNSPETWSPATVPFEEDTLIINSDVVMDADVAISVNVLIINTGHQLESAFVFALHGNLFNYGTIDIYNMAIGGGTLTRNEGLMRGTKVETSNDLFENNSIFETDSLIIGNPIFKNSGSISNDWIVTSDEFVNDGFIFASSLVSAGTFINNSDIKVHDWTSADGTVTGTGGKFCIADCFVNGATISGTLDICDATTSFCDVNFGDIAASVTLCEVGPCATAALSENIITNGFNVYPNPTLKFLTISTNDFNLAAQHVSIYSLDGNLLFQQQNNGEMLIELDLSHFSPGTYLCIIHGNDVVEQKMIVVQ